MARLGGRGAGADATRGRRRPRVGLEREIALLNAYQGYGWTAGLLLGIVWSATAGRVLGPVATQQSLFAACALSASVAGGTIVTRLAPAGLRGEALGVYTALSVLAGGIGSVVGGTLAGSLGVVPAFSAAGALVLAGGGLVATLRGISRRTGTVEAATPPSAED